MDRIKGFTIVELLIVVVVIAILAAITIVSYNGITASAHDTSVKTFLTSAYKKDAESTIVNGSTPCQGLDSPEIVDCFNNHPAYNSMAVGSLADGAASVRYNLFPEDDPVIVAKSKSGKYFNEDQGSLTEVTEQESNDAMNCVWMEWSSTTQLWTYRLTCN